MRFATVCCFLSFTLGALAQTPNRPRNIFDDDWEPPKRPAATQPVAAPKMTPKPVDPVTPTNVTPNVTVPSVTNVVPARRAVPKAADQAAVRKLMKEVYADQLKDTTPAGRRKLAKALLDQAEKLGSDTPTDQFVLLTAAVDAGVGGSTLPTAFVAAERLAKGFDVDGLGVKADAVTRLKSTVPTDAAENVRAALALASELEAVEDLATALRVCTAVQPIAAPTPDLRTQVAARIKELSAAKDLAERAARDREKLKASPEDPAANLAVGRYECFGKGNWEGGLPMLAKGSDAGLKSAAQAEVAAGEKPAPDVAVRLADGWYDLAGKQADPRAQAAIKAHAAGLYQAGIKDTTGLRRAQIEKRIAEAQKLQAAVAAVQPKAGTGRVDLLALFDPAKDTVKGQWESTAEGLISDRGNENRVAFPYQPPDEYDMTVEFTRLEGTEHVFLLFTWGGHNGGCILGSEGGKVCGISQIDGRAGSDDRNPTKKVVTSGAIHEGKRHRCVLEVRKSGVRALLDDVEVISFTGRPAQLSQNSPWAIQEGLVGVAKVGGRVAFHTVQVRPVTGVGKLLRTSAATIGNDRKTGPKKPRTIDLVPLFDHPDGIVSGKWTRAQGGMVSDGSKTARLQSSYRPPAQYDFLVEFSRPKSVGHVVLLLSRDDKSFEFQVGDTTRLSDIDGHARNRTQQKGPAEIQDANRHTAIVQVRKSGLKVLVDGKEVLDYPTDYSNLSRNSAWTLKDDRCLGVGVWDHPVVIYRAEITEVE